MPKPESSPPIQLLLEDHRRLYSDALARFDHHGLERLLSVYDDSFRLLLIGYALANTDHAIVRARIDLNMAEAMMDSDSKRENCAIMKRTLDAEIASRDKWWWVMQTYLAKATGTVR